MRILTYASDASVPVVLSYLPDDWEVVECLNLDEACVAASGAALVLVEQGTTERGLAAAEEMLERGLALPCLVIGEAPAPAGSRPEVLVRPFTLQDLTRAMERAARLAPITGQPEEEKSVGVAGTATERPPPGSQAEIQGKPGPAPSKNGATEPRSTQKAEPQSTGKEGVRADDEAPRPKESRGTERPAAPDRSQSAAASEGAANADVGKRPKKPPTEPVKPSRPIEPSPGPAPEPAPKTLSFPPKPAPQTPVKPAADAPARPAPPAAPAAPPQGASPTVPAAHVATVASAPVAVPPAPDAAAAPAARPAPASATPEPERELRRLTVRKTGERTGLGRLVGRRLPGAKPAPTPEEPAPGSPLLERIKGMVTAGRQLESLLEEMPALGNPRTIAHAFLEEVVEDLHPEIAAVYAPRSDGMYGVLAGHGLTKTEYGMKVAADQSLFLEVTNGLHGVLVAPVDLAQGLVAGIGGARTEALIAAPLAVGNQSFAIAIAGREDFSEVDLQRFTDLAGDAAPGIALAELIERLRSR